jgi:hypothetical protein
MARFSTASVQAVGKPRQIAELADSALGDAALESRSLGLRGGRCIGSSMAKIGCNRHCFRTAWKIMSARKPGSGEAFIDELELAALDSNFGCDPLVAHNHPHANKQVQININ